MHVHNLTTSIWVVYWPKDCLHIIEGCWFLSCICCLQKVLPVLQISMYFTINWSSYLQNTAAFCMALLLLVVVCCCNRVSWDWQKLHQLQPSELRDCCFFFFCKSLPEASNAYSDLTISGVVICKLQVQELVAWLWCIPLLLVGVLFCWLLNTIVDIPQCRRDCC